MYEGWSIKDLDKVPSNGRTVFSLFSCGGGSTMGYKLAGYEVLGNCEIDPRIAEMYKKNHNPQYSYVMDVRDFVMLGDNKLPEELFHLDVLVGSPPCSVFSLAGNREDDWGRMKFFKEGQKAQCLDDLFFEYIKVVDKLKPTVFIAENVRGLLFGSARGYVNEILKRIDGIGYKVQLYCLNAAKMGVPQRRERVFMIGRKKELAYPKLRLQFDEKPIRFGSVRSKNGVNVTEHSRELLKHKIPTDRKLADINMRLYNKNSSFNSSIIWDEDVAPTITANGSFFRAHDDKGLSDSDIICCQTFPYDYDFNGMSVQYVCGMSVPPLMMKRIAAEVATQWLQK